MRATSRRYPPPPWSGRKKGNDRPVARIWRSGSVRALGGEEGRPFYEVERAGELLEAEPRGLVDVGVTGQHIAEPGRGRRLLVGGGAAGCLSLSLNSADGRWRCGSGASTNLGGGDRADTWVSKGGGLCAGSCGVAAGAQATGMCRSTTPSTAAWASPPGSSAESASSRSEAAVLARRGASVAAGWSAGWTWHGAARVGNASLPLRVPARCRSLLWMRLLR